MTVRQVVQRALRAAGWELRRVGARATMDGGLAWLAAQHIPVATVLDVGASDGRWTAACQRAFPDARYVLFEPQPVHEAALGRIAHDPRIAVVHAAVGGAGGSTPFDARDPFGGVLTCARTAHTIDVACTTIDSTVDRLGLAGPFLLKLDTHGAERRIFHGATDTLPDCAALIVEAYTFRLGDDAFLFWELCAYLADRGFRPVDCVDVLHRQHDDALWQMDLVFVHESWAGFQHPHYR